MSRLAVPDMTAIRELAEWATTPQLALAIQSESGRQKAEELLEWTRAWQAELKRMQATFNRAEKALNRGLKATRRGRFL